MADEDDEENATMSALVPELEIVGSALNQRTGMVTLFLMSPAKRTEMEAAGREMTTEWLMTETEFAIELREHEMAWALTSFVALANEQQAWRRALEARARNN